jgi:hypothetical protein
MEHFRCLSLEVRLAEGGLCPGRVAPGAWQPHGRNSGVEGGDSALFESRLFMAVGVVSLRQGYGELQCVTASA